MFKKNDLLPLVLAFVSTILIVGMGFFWLVKAENNSFSSKKESKQDISVEESDTAVSKATNVAKRNFGVPYIVPQGTSVEINGSQKMAQLNQSLRKSFHQQFPGTYITASADGNDVGIKLLASGDIDIAATDRPLNETEKASGLKAMKIDSEVLADNTTQEMYYAYREPANSEVEAFLGYVLSPQGRLAIKEKQN